MKLSRNLQIIRKFYTAALFGTHDTLEKYNKTKNTLRALLPSGYFYFRMSNSVLAANYPNTA